MPIPELLRDLLAAPGPAGHEVAAAAAWRSCAAGFAEVRTDTLGTSYARVRAPNGGATLAVVAHIDEIGFAITHVDENGLLAISALGGFSAEMLLGQRVVIAGRDGPVRGVVGRRESDERGGDRPRVEFSDLHVDIGASTREEAVGRVRPGDAGVWEGEAFELAEGTIASKALDNRLGCYVVLEAARRVAEAGDARVDMVAVAAVQEELGSAGSRTAAFSLEPEVALAVDVTYATDVPGRSARRAGRTDLGDGAAVTRGPVVHRAVSDLLATTADEEGIRHVFDVYTGRTHTDADVVHVSRAGVPTGLVSIPVRYMHSPVEVASLDDIEAAVALIAAFARRLTPEMSFLR